MKVKSYFREGLLILMTGLVAACGGGNNTAAPPDGGSSVAAKTSAIAMSAGDPDCPSGGVLVETGIDDNKNSVLDAGEVDDTQKVCNGAEGANGSSGLNSLVTLTQEAKGANCARGGVRVDAGLDTDTDSTLDTGEITSTQYLCNNTGDAIGWAVAMALEQDNAGRADSPHVAIDGSGNAVAVWSQSDGTRWNVWANHYTAQ